MSNYGEFLETLAFRKSTNPRYFVFHFRVIQSIRQERINLKRNLKEIKT